jgi:hypothetical protein
LQRVYDEDNAGKKTINSISTSEQPATRDTIPTKQPNVPVLMRALRRGINVSGGGGVCR